MHCGSGQNRQENYEYVLSPPPRYIQKMVKRNREQKAPIKRSRTIANCLREAQSFARPRRTIVTRSMALAAEESRKRRQDERRVPEAPKKIKKARGRVRRLPVRPARPSLPAVPAVPARLPAVSIPAVPHLKKTVFKAQKKGDLPLPAFGFIDVCFCIDATGSMSGEIQQAKSTIEAIVRKLESKVALEGITLRFAILHYLDHECGAEYITRWKDFTDADEAVEYAKGINLGSGGDYPEAIHDAVIDACTKLNWVELPGTPMLRYIFHIADAPPHGTDFANTHQKQKGCKCGLTTAQMFHEVNARQIHYRLIKVRPNQQLKTMENVFRKNCTNFDCAEIKHAQEMDVRVSDMIIHEVLPQG